MINLKRIRERKWQLDNYGLIFNQLGFVQILLAFLRHDTTTQLLDREK